MPSKMLSYLWFIAVHWGEAEFYSETAVNFMPLWKALGQFIYNGGVNWEKGPNFHWSFLLFLFAFFGMIA